MSNTSVIHHRFVKDDKLQETIYRQTDGGIVSATCSVEQVPDFHPLNQQIMDRDDVVKVCAYFGQTDKVIEVKEWTRDCSQVQVYPNRSEFDEAIGCWLINCTLPIDE